jgi:integrase
MRIESMLDYAKAKSWREADNPARWRGHLANILLARQNQVQNHYAAMAYADLPAFWQRLKNKEALAARVLEILILTASRTSEILKAPWDEFDLDGGLWVIPAECMTAKRDHRIPLTGEVFGLSKSTSTILSGFPASKAAAARVLINLLPTYFAISGPQEIHLT